MDAVVHEDEGTEVDHGIVMLKEVEAEVPMGFTYLETYDLVAGRLLHHGVLEHVHIQCHLLLREILYDVAPRLWAALLHVDAATGA